MIANHNDEKQGGLKVNVRTLGIDLAKNISGSRGRRERQDFGSAPTSTASALPGTADKLSAFFTVTLTQALEHQQSIRCFAVYADSFEETQHRPQPSIPESRMRFDQTLNALRQDFVEPGGVSQQLSRAPAAGHGKISAPCA
jgi:hypothetical protein